MPPAQQPAVSSSSFMPEESLEPLDLPPSMTTPPPPLPALDFSMHAKQAPIGMSADRSSEPAESAEDADVAVVDARPSGAPVFATPPAAPQTNGHSYLGAPQQPPAENGTPQGPPPPVPPPIMPPTTPSQNPYLNAQ